MKLLPQTDVDGSIISVLFGRMVQLSGIAQFIGCQKLVLMKSMALFVISGLAWAGRKAHLVTQLITSSRPSMELVVAKTFKVARSPGVLKLGLSQVWTPLWRRS